MRTILFLGSNTSKKHHFEYARNHGYKLAVMKENPKDKDHEFFDYVIKTDMFDYKDIIKKVDKLNKKSPLEACLTRFEPFVPIVGLICDRFNIPGPSYESTINARDKLSMREAFEKDGIPQPKFLKIESPEDLQTAKEKLGFPFLLKPLSGAKSRNIIMISEDRDIVGAYEKISSNCEQNKLTLFDNYKNFPGYERDYCKTFIAEEYIEGNQITTTSFIFNDKVFHIALADLITAKDLNQEGFFLAARTTPSELPDDYSNKIRLLSSNGIRALGLDNTCVHPEIILTKEGPKIIEIGARIGGYRAEMTDFAFGIDLNRIAIEIALGLTPHFIRTRNKSSTAVEVWPRGNGVIKNFENLNEVSKFPGIYNFKLKLKEGDMYTKPPIGDKPIATFFTFSDDPIRSKNLAAIILEKFKISFKN